MSRFWLMFASLLLVLLLAMSAMAACGGPAAPAGDVPIGVAYSTGGAGGKLGGELLLGLQLATKYYNTEKGGVTVGGQKYTIKLLEYNSNSNPQEGVSTIKRLMEVEKVPFIIGDCLSGVVTAQQPVIEQAKWPWIMNAGAAQLTSPDFKYTFRCNWRHGLLSEDFWKMASAAMGNKKKLAVFATGNDYGKSQLAEAEKWAPQVGFSVVFKDTFTPGAADFYPVLAKLKSLSPDLVYMVNYGEIAPMITQAKEQAFSTTWVMDDTVDPAELAKQIGDRAVGVRVFSSINPTLDTDIAKTYRKYLVEVKGPLAVNAASYALGWDTGMRTFLAFEKANTISDRQKLYEAIRQVEWDGVCSTGKFDGIGQIGVKGNLLELIKGDGTCKGIGSGGRLL